MCATCHLWLSSSQERHLSHYDFLLPPGRETPPAQNIVDVATFLWSEDGTREDPQNQTIINGSLWVNLENSSCSASENNKTPEPPKEQPVFNCPICMSALEEETSTRCGHIFCKNCIRAALSAQAKCPTCRKVTRNSLIRDLYPIIICGVSGFRNVRRRFIVLCRMLSSAECLCCC
ncbi:E3 ubiquitin-protein ligase COP1 [Glycine soja]